MNVIGNLKLICLPFLIYIIPSISCAQNDSLNLQTGVSRNAIQQNLKTAMWNAPDGPHIAEAIVESEATGIYYWLFRASSIGQFDLNQVRNLSGWPLNTFNDNDLEPEISRIYTEYQIEPSARTAENLSPILGCLYQHPLRYGDITQDGSAELVIFAQDEYGALNASIFSTASKKVIFSVRLATYDAVVNDRLVVADGEEEIASDPLANKLTDGQYLSRIAEENTRMVKGIRPAVINFSKLYFGDFDNDDVVDIVSWRKLYNTRLNQDSVKGFELDRNTLIHYKLVDGEYKKQDTESSVVKGGLTTKNLTWQKGYPSKSECPDQEGQLIPEMHDPLLNDPDVLK
jgi:hypothetical protein